MAFTLWDVKMFVVVNILQERALPNEFCSQMFLIYFVCAFSIAIPHGFAFYCTSCKYLVFCWHPNLMPMQIVLALMSRCLMHEMHSKMLHHFLSKITLCIYNTMSFSGHPVCHLGLNWCILLGLFLFF